MGLDWPRRARRRPRRFPASARSARVRRVPLEREDARRGGSENSHEREAEHTCRRSVSDGSDVVGDPRPSHCTLHRGGRRPSGPRSAGARLDLSALRPRPPARSNYPEKSAEQFAELAAKVVVIGRGAHRRDDPKTPKKERAWRSPKEIREHRATTLAGADTAWWVPSGRIREDRLEAMVS